MPDHHAALLSRIQAGTARVGIIGLGYVGLPLARAYVAQSDDAHAGRSGLGYVGLPLARAFAAKEFPVLGFDIDPEKVARLRRGQSYIGHIPADVIARMRARGFEATDDFGRLGEPDAIVICVPT